MDRIIAAFCILIGGFWAYRGVFDYGIWVDKGPGGGFLPFVIGLLTVVLGLLLMKKTFKSKSQDKANEESILKLRTFIPVIAVLASLLMIKLIGMIFSMVLMVFIWLKFLEKYSYTRSILASLLVGLFVYGVFGLWLKVLFPEGILGLL